jgi:hypothetical protein
MLVAIPLGEYPARFFCVARPFYAEKHDMTEFRGRLCRGIGGSVRGGRRAPSWRLLARQFEATFVMFSSAPLEAQLLALLVIAIEISISIFLVFKCAGALKSYRDEFAIAGKERAAQRSDDAASWLWTCCSLDLQSGKLAVFNVGVRAKDALFDCE